MVLGSPQPLRVAARRSEATLGYFAIAANVAPVIAARSAGASSMSKPRRPPETNTVSNRIGRLVEHRRQCGVFWPIGLMPPTT